MTPTLQQFREVKARHPGMCLLFRTGDHVHAFAEDAELLSRLFGCMLAAHDDCDTVTFPANMIDGYLQRLTQNGHRVAVCTPGEFGKEWLVRRVVMPGERKPGEFVELGEPRGVNRNES